MGFTLPRTFETWVHATIFVFGVMMAGAIYLTTPKDKKKKGSAAPAETAEGGNA